MIDKDKVQAARDADLVAFLKSAGVRLERESGRSKKGLPQYRVPGMGGLIVSGSAWYHFTTGKGGNAVDYLMEFMGKTFKEAVEVLAGRGSVRPVVVDLIPRQRPAERREFVLPPRAGDNSRVIEYLEKRRGIERQMIEQIIQEGLLYQDVKGNCVFVCRDADGVPRAAYLRGTGSSRFVGLVKGSNRLYGWRRMVCAESTFVVVAESPIDIMSWAMLFPEWAGIFNWIALNGVYLPAADKFLEDNKHVQSVLLIFDHDPVGQGAADRYVNSLGRKGYRVLSVCSGQEGEDMNDVLLNKQNGEDFAEKKILCMDWVRTTK